LLGRHKKNKLQFINQITRKISQNKKCLYKN